LRRYFNTIVSGTNLPAKPEPDVFLKAAKDLGCLPADCLVIEDSLAGVKRRKLPGCTVLLFQPLMHGKN
jgi:HAD superfamily hydrolase (TIGR01509 family)